MLNEPAEQPLEWEEDGRARPLRVNAERLGPAINFVRRDRGVAIDPLTWERGDIVPTIVEAAQALYRGHAVEEISRSEAGAE